MSNWLIISLILVVIGVYWMRQRAKSEPEVQQDDDLFARADALLKETDEMLAGSDDMLRQLSSLSAEEERWAGWFMSLSEPQKQLVEQLGEKGFKVDPDNADEVFGKARKRGLDV